MRKPEARELRRELASLLKTGSVDEVARFVDIHSNVLGERAARLSDLAASDVARMAVDVRERLEQLIARQADARRKNAERRALAAAAELTKDAYWDGGRVYLSPKLVLAAALRADRRKRTLMFAVDGFPSIAVSTARLLKASRALNFEDLVCYLDDGGWLSFRWRGGKGGLRLNERGISNEAMAHALHLSIPAAASSRVQDLHAA